MINKFITVQSASESATHEALILYQMHKFYLLPWEGLRFPFRFVVTSETGRKQIFPFLTPTAHNKKICFDFWIMFHQMGFVDDTTGEGNKISKVYKHHQ